MAPEINSGDFVFISSIPLKLRLLKKGMRIVFDCPGYGRLIKKITGFTRDRGRFFFAGTRPSSISSDETGPIKTAHILGTVLFVIRSEKQNAPNSLKTGSS